LPARYNTQTHTYIIHATALSHPATDAIIPPALRWLAHVRALYLLPPLLFLRLLSPSLLGFS